MSLCLCVCLSLQLVTYICLSVCLSVWLSDSLSVQLLIYVSLSLCLSAPPTGNVYLSVCVFAFVSLVLKLCILRGWLWRPETSSGRLSLGRQRKDHAHTRWKKSVILLSVCLSVFQPDWPACRSVCLSVCVCLSVSVYLSVCLCIFKLIQQSVLRRSTVFANSTRTGAELRRRAETNGRLVSKYHGRQVPRTEGVVQTKVFQAQKN